MDCKEFHHWLNTRDIHGCILPREISSHMAACHDCERMLQKDDTLERCITRSFAMEELPRGLADRVDATLEHESSRRFSGPLNRPIALVSASLLAGLLVLVLIFTNLFPTPSNTFKDLNQISRQAVTDHLKGNRHMTFDARQTNQALAHLTQKLGFKVLLPNLATLDCVLLGGRLCTLGDCKAAYFVIEKQGKTGSLFIMNTDHLAFEMSDGSRFMTSLKGCDTRVWKDHGQVYAMVF